MKKYLLIFILSVLAAGVIFAQITNSSENSSDSDLSYTDFSPVQKWAIGTGIEWNMNSTKDFAAALGVHLGADYSINSSFAAGFDLGLSFSDILTLEAAPFFRWYFLKDIQMFVQADAGLWIGTDVGKTFLLGVTGGARLPLANNFYIEPYTRIGYPFMYGIGVNAGIRLPLIKTSGSSNKKTTFLNQVEAIVREYGDDSIWVELDGDGRLRLMVYVVFAPDSSELKGLSPEIMARNEKTIKDVSEILKRAKYSGIIVEGHANPTTSEGSARNREEPELKVLSQARALTVVNELKRYGVNLDKIDIQGAGSSGMIAPYDDASNNWRNRRVEFIMVQ